MILLSTVQRISRLVMKGEKAFAAELQRLWLEKRKEKPQQAETELKRMQKRYDELSELVRGLYENLVSGLLPERQYKQLMKQYDDEQAELEIKIEKLQSEVAKKLARQRAAEKARRERHKAKKIAENGGEIVCKKICPHCGKEFIPTSNRQVFCSKECRYQTEQAEKKAKREAKRGDHYYRQRKCAVCGKLFWPNSSGQTVCSEECRKKHHNEYSLEWWHKNKPRKSCGRWCDWLFHWQTQEGKKF